MARGKVRLAYIQNDSKRRTTYRKRKNGIVKKLDELTTLCAVQACCIIYSIFDPRPMVWPSVEEAHRLITKFRSSPVVDQKKRKVNQETFMKQMLEKTEEKLKKVQAENRRKEITQVMYQSMMNLLATFSRLDMGDLEDLKKVTKQKRIEIERMMEIRVGQESLFNPPPLPPQGGSQQLVFSHQESVLPDQYESFSMPIMSFPPFPSLGFPSINMEFSPQPFEGGLGGDSVQDGDQQHVLRNEFEFIPPNHNEFEFMPPNPAFFTPNMMFPPSLSMQFSLPPPQSRAYNNGVEGGGQQLVLSNQLESMSTPNHNSFESLSPGFGMPNLVFPPPPLMPFSLPSMDPNIEIPYHNNQPMFPFNYNPNLPPHDP